MEITGLHTINWTCNFYDGMATTLPKVISISLDPLKCTWLASDL
jgi:hypothetical protein